MTKQVDLTPEQHLRHSLVSIASEFTANAPQIFELADDLYQYVMTGSVPGRRVN